MEPGVRPDKGQLDRDPSDKEQSGAYHDVAGVEKTSQGCHRSYCHRRSDEEQQRDSGKKETAVRKSGVDALPERDPAPDQADDTSVRRKGNESGDYCRCDLQRSPRASGHV